MKIKLEAHNKSKRQKLKELESISSDSHLPESEYSWYILWYQKPMFVCFDYLRHS